MALMYKKALIIGLVGLAALVVLNGLAYQYFWYWQYRLADVPMHLLGGITVVALVLAWVRHPVRWFAVLGILLLVSGAWELFEFKFSHFLPVEVVFKALPVWERGVADTFSDILFDVLGGLLAYSFLKHGGNRTISEEVKT